MGTRSNICRQNKDGSYDVIYCHWNGYPSHNGKILFEHYQDADKIDQLLKLRDLSRLGAELGEKHDFNKAPDGVCNAYGRDRGESNVSADHYASYNELCEMLADAWTEWVYIYRVEDGKWYYTNNPSPTWFKCCGEQRQTDLLTPDAWKAEE